MADVLIIDSEYASRLTLKIALRNQGFIPDLSDSPEEAVEKVRINHYNWVICDLKMGAFDGVTLAAKIRELKPEMKIVFTSSFMTKEDIPDANIDAFIERPIDILDLTKIFRKQEKGFKDKNKGFQIDLDLAVND